MYWSSLYSTNTLYEKKAFLHSSLKYNKKSNISWIKNKCSGSFVRMAEEGPDIKPVQNGEFEKNKWNVKGYISTKEFWFKIVIRQRLL